MGSILIVCSGPGPIFSPDQPCPSTGWVVGEGERECVKCRSERVHPAVWPFQIGSKTHWDHQPVVDSPQTVGEVSCTWWCSPDWRQIVCWKLFFQLLRVVIYSYKLITAREYNAHVRPVTIIWGCAHSTRVLFWWWNLHHAHYTLSLTYA